MPAPAAKFLGAIRRAICDECNKKKKDRLEETSVAALTRRRKRIRNDED